MLLTIAASITFSIFFIQIHQLHKKLRLNFKPFSCVQCLAFWLAIIFYFLPSYILIVLFTVCFASVAAAITARLLDQWR